MADQLVRVVGISCGAADCSCVVAAGGFLNYPIRHKLHKGASSPVQELYATQLIDNFNPQNAATYQERYFVNGECVTVAACWSDRPRSDCCEWAIHASLLAGALLYEQRNTGRRTAPSSSCWAEKLLVRAWVWLVGARSVFDTPRRCLCCRGSDLGC